MLDKPNPYTFTGQLMVAAGFLNLMARVNIWVDTIIMFILLAKGGSLIRDKKWLFNREANYASASTGIFYPLFKLVFFYLTITKENDANLQAVIVSSLFLLPMSIISIFVLVKLKKLDKTEPDK